jgi:uncharacterized membrane protein
MRTLFDNYLVNLLLGGLILVILDAPFLSFISQRYVPMMTTITGSPPQFSLATNQAKLAVLLAYLFMSLALKELAMPSDRAAILTGLTIYGIYSFTNAFIFPRWNWTTAIIETLWGAILYFLARRVMVYLSNYLN